MSARDDCSVMVAGEKKSFALSSLSGNPGTFIMPAYSTGGVPPTAWVMSAVMLSLGSVLRSFRSEKVVRLELVEREPGHLHYAGVQHRWSAPDRVGDVGRHALARQRVAQR